MRAGWAWDGVGTYLGSCRLTAGREGPGTGEGLAVLSRQWSSKQGSPGPGTCLEVTPVRYVGVCAMFV